MKHFFAIPIMLIALSACSFMATMSDYVANNPLIAQIATRQAVAQYISAGVTVEDEIKRAQQVESRITKVLVFLDGNERATPDQLLTVIRATINWDQLTYADQILIEDIISLVDIELSKADAAQMPETTELVLSTIFKTALSAAKLYMGR